MFPNIKRVLQQINPDYREGVEKGFQIAESYFKDATKQYYKMVKKGYLNGLATYSTATNHKCNCEFCTLDKKD